MYILIADDEIEFCDTIATLLRSEGWETTIATSPPAVLQAIATEGDRIHAVLLDLDFRHPEMNGLDILQKIRQSHPTLPVLILTGAGTIDTAVQATRLGAMAFLQKSELTPEKIRKELYEIAEKVRQENAEILRQLAQFGIVGYSQAMQDIARIIYLFAKTDLNILITGETGTGKGLIARTIHELSPRRKYPFVHIDLPNIPRDLFQSELFGHKKGAFTGADRDKEGLFHKADKGTIFLDEIGDLDPERQAGLLIPIEQKRIHRLGDTNWIDIDVRFIAATDKDLETAIQNGEFRSQLYYRLNEARIHIPPLRERPEDIRPIVEHYVQLFNRQRHQEKFFEPAALELLEQQSWQGNVRELVQFVKRCYEISVGPAIRLPDVALLLRQHRFLHPSPAVPPESGPSFPGSPPSSGASPSDTRTSLSDAIASIKKEKIVELLKKHHGNITKTAEELGVSRETVYQYLRKFNIDQNQFRNRNPRRP